MLSSSMNNDEKPKDAEMTMHENPSPSGDTWFDDPKNMRHINEAVNQAKNGELKTYSIDDIKSALEWS